MAIGKVNWQLHGEQVISNVRSRKKIASDLALSYTVVNTINHTWVRYGYNCKDSNIYPERVVSGGE